MLPTGRPAVVRKSDRPADDKPAREPPPHIAHATAPNPADLYDTSLRLALSLIEAKDWDQLAARTGIVCGSPEAQFLNLFVEFEPPAVRNKETGKFNLERLIQFEMLAPLAYIREFAVNPALRTIAARIELDPANPAFTRNGTPLAKLLGDISNSDAFRRIRIAIPHGACLERSLRSLELPPGRVYKTHDLTGEDIVIGIIDDGCAFAHPDFLDIRKTRKGRSYRGRVLALWDQSQAATASDKTAGWSDLADFGYGRELSQTAIDASLANHSSKHGVREDEVYAELRYDVGLPAERATHGTRVMGIAAGSGNSLMGWEGVAPRADIVFVQLPPNAIREAPKLLSTHIVHGVAYIFRRAEELGRKAAVVNISYGGYAGPHDGTSAWEKAIDELLEVRDRAVVVAAGNGFAANCHAMGTLQPGQEAKLRWVLKPADATVNDLEIWYTGGATLAVTLSTPEGDAFGPFGFTGTTDLVRPKDGLKLGSIEHVQHDPTNGDNSVTIALRATASVASQVASLVPIPTPPAGTWIVALRNDGNQAAEFHGWVQRDDVGLEGFSQQSTFAPEDAHPAFTLGDFATGALTIAAGAFNAATDEVCGYSACGPTRASAASASRTKPEFCAPAEELATRGGVLASGSRQASPRRLNGTSAAAPHVAGVVALVFDYRRNKQKKHLSAAALRAALAPQTGGQPLAPERHASARGGKVKQSDVFADLTGAGKISCERTLDNL